MPEKISKARRSIEVLYDVSLEKMLDAELERIVQDLRAETSVSPADFARLIEFHRERYGLPAPPEKKVTWFDDQIGCE